MIKIARCLRKVENEDFWIVYDNTIDMVFPYMFDSLGAGDYFISCFNDGGNNIIPNDYLNPISLEELNKWRREQLTNQR